MKAGNGWILKFPRSQRLANPYVGVCPMVGLNTVASKWLIIYNKTAEIVCLLQNEMPALAQIH